MQKAYAAITTALIVSSALLGMAVVASFTSIDSGQSSLALDRNEELRHFVDGCAEDALLKYRSIPNYTGGTTTTPEGTCQVTVSVQPNYRTLTIISSATDYSKTMVLHARRTRTLTVSYWKEE